MSVTFAQILSADIHIITNIQVKHSFHFRQHIFSRPRNFQAQKLSVFYIHRKLVPNQLPVSRGTWETEQKSGHTEFFIVFVFIEKKSKRIYWTYKVE